jgi:hypothetical protein
VPTTVSRARGVRSTRFAISDLAISSCCATPYTAPPRGGGPIAWLAIIALKFDPAKDVVWEKGAEPPRFEMV